MPAAKGPGQTPPGPVHGANKPSEDFYDLVARTEAKAAAAAHKRELEKDKADHLREIDLKELKHKQTLAEDAAKHERDEATRSAAHRRKITWAMIVSSSVVCLACVGVGLHPSLSDDLKKTIIGVLAIFLSGGLGLALGKATAAK